MTRCIQDEMLSRYAAGDCDPEEARSVRAHVEACGSCQTRLDGLRRADAALREAAASPVPDRIAASVWRAIAEELNSRPAPEIMTLEDVARYLRIPSSDLEPFLEDLPCFEFAGRVRIRRTRLLEWIGEREQRYRTGAQRAAAFGTEPLVFDGV
ncbi:MAG: zf-HC2 domain-containing protein [bacterium]|nr:zf-HC2 domain-containing protein [bacterium]